MEQEVNNKKEIKKIPFYKKVGYSITKYEKYPEMATEGTGRAIGYLSLLMFIFAVIVAIALIIQLNSMAKKGIKFVNENFSQIDYQNGQLTISPINQTTTNFGNVIINTTELTNEEIKKYEGNSNRAEFIWLKDRVIAKYASNTVTYYYKDVLDGFGIKEFDKTALIKFMQNTIKKPQLYIIYGIAIIIYTFIVYFISTLVDILILSLFGMLTTIIAKIKMRYRAVFNMSVYAITISTLLRLIYMYIRIFTDFTIKYFDLMYTAISFICLAAAIFMIKSDVIRQQIEIMRMIEIKRHEQKEEAEKEDNEKENKEEEEKGKEEDKNKENEEKNETTQGEGSNA